MVYSKYVFLGTHDELLSVLNDVSLVRAFIFKVTHDELLSVLNDVSLVRVFIFKCIFLERSSFVFHSKIKSTFLGIRNSIFHDNTENI